VTKNGELLWHFCIVVSAEREEYEEDCLKIGGGHLNLIRQLELYESNLKNNAIHEVPGMVDSSDV